MCLIKVPVPRVQAKPNHYLGWQARLQLLQLLQHQPLGQVHVQEGVHRHHGGDQADETGVVSIIYLYRRFLEWAPNVVQQSTTYHASYHTYIPTTWEGKGNWII